MQKENNQNEITKDSIETVNKTEKIEEKNQESKKRRRKIVLAITAIVLAICYIYARGNYLEMKEIGEKYIEVFKKDFIYTIITFVVNFIILFFSFYFTNKTIRKGLKVFFDDEKKEMPKFPNKSVSFVIALIGSLLSTKMLLNKILLCFSGSRFGIADPVFHIDISFFVFIKPLIQFILIYLLVIVIATLVYAVVYSLIVLNKSFDGVSRESIAKCDLVSKVGMRVKLIGILIGLIVIAFMVLNIGNEKFMNIELTDGTQYSIYGAGNGDTTVKLAGYVLLAILCVISIFKAYKALKEKSTRRVLGNLMIVPIYLIILAVVLAGYQLIFVGSNALDKNQNFIKENIEKTKQAYGITTENVTEKNIQYSGTLTSAEISKNQDLLTNIAIVNKQNVLQDLNAAQTAKGYYSFRQAQIASYNIDGKSTLVYVTPREISDKDATYSNKTYQYTHGYGSIITLAESTDEYGNLKNIQKDFGDTSNETIPIKQPRIYFGMDTNNAIVINSKKSELDYPTSDLNNENEYNYTGNAGLKLNLLDRIILGIKEGDMNLAFSGSVTGESSIITNRNIIDRAKTIMPYLMYDENPYMVIDDDGNQIWVLDAYTVTNEYPFAQKTELSETKEINYIRNSVKVLINAYDGTMNFYITDRTDPIAMAYNKIYPDIFKNSDEISEGISKHFIYSQYLYDIQSKIIDKYHNIQPETLYRANDVWDVAETFDSDKTEKMKSYYTMVKNENGDLEIGLVIPYTLYGKQNITSYMIGTSVNGTNKLTLCNFEADSNVLSPIQLETQINQDETIASDIASLNVSGSKITKNLIAIPINNTILYVETYYQQYINESTQKPTLKRVVVASGNKVAIGNSLTEALENLMSKSAVDINVPTGENTDELINLIIKANENVKSSSKNSDWKLFGEDMQTLTKLIDQLKNTVEKNKTEATLTENTINVNDIRNSVGE